MLGTDLSSLKSLLRSSDNYRCFEIFKGSKVRIIEAPNPKMDRVHKLIFKLFQRIETPNYLHSGKKNHSHVTNAAVHTEAACLAKLDISSFYQATNRDKIYWLFIDRFKASPDVAKLLSEICVTNGYLPTGGRVSQLLAFWANENMFNAINSLSESYKLMFSLYVDDLAFSGATVSGEFLWEVKKLIHNNGYKYHKEESYTPHQVKLITGTAIANGRLVVRNKHHLKIYGLYQKLLKGTIDIDEMTSLKGLLASVSQVSDKYKNILQYLNKTSRPPAN
jgi:hypothetical protein